MSEPDEVGGIPGGRIQPMSEQLGSKRFSTERRPWPMALPDGSGYIVLFEGFDGLPSLIVCCEADGSLRWQVLPPEGKSDCWKLVEVQSDAVVGTSGSGWRVAVDSASGCEVTRRRTARGERDWHA
jgi:hypothetical protein